MNDEVIKNRINDANEENNDRIAVLEKMRFSSRNIKKKKVLSESQKMQ